jgi:hypothetical protein
MGRTAEAFRSCGLETALADADVDRGTCRRIGKQGSGTHVDWMSLGTAANPGGVGEHQRWLDDESHPSEQEGATYMG